MRIFNVKIVYSLPDWITMARVRISCTGIPGARFSHGSKVAPLEKPDYHCLKLTREEALKGR